MLGVIRKHHMNVFTVLEAAQIRGRGTAVFLVEEPRSFGMKSCRVNVIQPSGVEFEAIAVVEYARKVPPGEVAVLLFPERSVSEFPSGTRISLL